MTAIDNVINYRLNDSNPIGARLERETPECARR
jgi:hypothetical protein